MKIKPTWAVFCLFSLLLQLVLPVQAQKYHFYRNDGKHNVYDASKLDSMTFTEGNMFRQGKTQLYFKNQAYFDIDNKDIDSITFGDVCRVAQMNIQTENNLPVVSKDDYVRCKIEVDGLNMFDNYVGTGRIRGRGNSTWGWYPKKPYRIKLDESSKMLGLKKNKDWVLLANYRDPTFLMNAFAFELGDYLDMPFTNHNRFCEVTLNGDFLGLYLLTEQVEQGGNRVDIHETKGVLISLDLDDGPSLSPHETNNFWSSVYRLPVAVKWPKDEALTPEVKSAIREDFAELENLIEEHSCEKVAERLDLKSFMDFYIVQEMTYNVELAAPRSMYMHKDSDQIWHFGPIWDFDAGFNFDWGSSHDYFDTPSGNYATTLFGVDPARNPSRGDISLFFRHLFESRTFVLQFKAYWKSVKPAMVAQVTAKMDNYKLQIEEAMKRHGEVWPIGKNFQVEYNRLMEWFSRRVESLDKTIARYPEKYGL